MSENEVPPLVSLDPADIQSTDVPRRSFLRGFGVIAGTAALTTQAACAELFSPSDACTPADPVGAASDNDPTDPIRSDSDPQCDSD